MVRGSWKNPKNGAETAVAIRRIPTSILLPDSMKLCFVKPHPCLLQYHDFVEEKGCVYLAHTLCTATMAAKHAVDPLLIIKQLSSALSQLHKQGRVLGVLTPETVMLESSSASRLAYEPYLAHELDLNWSAPEVTCLEECSASTDIFLLWTRVAFHLDWWRSSLLQARSPMLPEITSPWTSMN